MLKWSIKVAAVALAFSLLGAPVMACMLTDTTESAEARECCRQMADQCGDMGMPSTHSCCQPTIHQTDYVAKSRFTSGRDQHLFSFLSLETNDFTFGAFSQAGYRVPAHSPSISRAEILSVLRI